MKKFVLVLIVSLLGIGTSFSQAPQKSPITYVGKLNLSITHTQHDLEELNKSMLAKVYKRRVRVFLELLPFLALKIPPNKHVGDLELPPMTKDRAKAAKKQEKIRRSYFENLSHTMLAINSHADKEDLIEMITIIDLQIAHIKEFYKRD